MILIMYYSVIVGGQLLWQVLLISALFSKQVAPAHFLISSFPCHHRFITLNSSNSVTRLAGEV